MSLTPGTPRSGVTVAGALTVAPYNLYRRGLTFQNTSDTAMMLREDGGDASSTSGYLISTGDEVAVSTNQLISVWCSVAGKTFAATEF